MVFKVVPSTCTECLVHCGSLLHVDNDTVLKITGNPEHPVSKGAFCIKGLNAPVANRESATRVTYPLKRTGRRGEKKWERLSWDDAFEQIAHGLKSVKARHGPLSIAGGAATFTQSRGTAVRLMLRALGSPNFMINQDMCHGGRSTAAVLTGFSGGPGSEITRARVVLVVGKSPSESDIIEWRHIQTAKANGSKVIVIDPRRTKLARLADIWLAPKVGTDAIVALSMAQVILHENLCDFEFLDSWCSGLDDLRQRASKYPPPVAEGITGIPQADIQRSAQAFAEVKPGCLILGHGIDAHKSGVATAIAFQSLLALTGNIDRPGSNRAAKPLAGYRGSFGHFMQHSDYQLPPDRQRQILGGSQFPLWCGPDSWTQTCHNPTVLEAIKTGHPYPVRALYISGTNIVCTYPDQASTIEALKMLDLLIVAGDEMTPTGELADFFLPKTTLLEEEEILMEQSEPCLSMTRQVLEPLGEAKTDVEIVAGLCGVFRKHGLIEFDVFPWTSNDEFNEYVLKNTPVHIESLRASGFHAVPYGYQDYRSTGFKTPSKKFELAPSRIASLESDSWPENTPSIEDESDSEYDFILMTGIRSMAFHHSRFLNHAWSRRLKNAPEITVHPEAARRRGLNEGDWVWVQTKEMPTRALLLTKVSDDLPENVAATGMGWWYPEFSDPTHGASIFNIGVAMPYGPDFDPISGSPAQARNTVCKIERAATADVAHLLAQIDPPLPKAKAKG